MIAMAKMKRSSAAGRSAVQPRKRALVYALSSLEHDVEKLPKEFEYVIHPGKHLLLTYLRGIVYGLGALTAAVIVIPFVLWALQKLPPFPVIGEYVNRAATQVQQVRP